MDNQIINPVPQATPLIQPKTETPNLSEENVKFAGFLTRYVALTFDWELLIFIALLMGYVVPHFVKNYQNMIGLGLSLLFIIYKIIAVKIYGRTIGKRIFRIKVIGINGKKITWLQAIIRELVSFFISLPFLVGEFLYFFSNKKQTLHDKFASTIVIQENSITVFKKILAFIVVLIIPIIYVLFIIFMGTKQMVDKNKKNDLIDSISQKTQLMIQVKELCQSLPSFQSNQIICVMNNESSCILSKMSFEKLQDLNTQMEKSITDCINYQSELEKQKRISF